VKGIERDFRLGQFLELLDGILRERAFLANKKVIGVWENDQTLGFG
jgi:hypothetical protein